MVKSKTNSFILNLPLNIEKYQENIINKRLEIGRHMYNSLVNIVIKRYNFMKESKEYNKVKKELKYINNKFHNCTVVKTKKEYDKERKILYTQLQEIYLKHGLTTYSLYEDVKPMYKHFKDNIGSLEAQAIADRVCSGLDKLLKGDSERIYFKKYDDFNSIENKWNKSGLKYDIGKNCIIWSNLLIPVIIKENDVYAQMAIQNRIKYCRIVRKTIRGKYKYYVQLIMEGIPPIKINRETGEVKHSIGIDRVGIDIGTQTIGICSKNNVKLLELCPEVDNIEKQKRVLMRKMDRQRRANNPNNYNEDGTIKKQGNKKVKWIKSNKYIKTQNELKEIQRKQAVIRKQSHEQLANYILSLGDTVLVETMNYKGLQKRSKETTINKTGKFNKKKRFGKSLANKAPAMLLEIIDRKLKYIDLKLLKVNTYKCKASQYNHFTDDYNKKELKDRWNNDIEIQRDMYSAFLIMNVNNDLENINREDCLKTYDRFKVLHDKEINRLKELKASGVKLISSMGI